MLFNSIHFLIFFPLVAVIYFMLPHRYRWALLLVASYYFYMAWKPEYVILLIISTLTSYYAGLWMGKTADMSKRKLYLVLGLGASLGILFLYKYFNFFNESTRALFNQFNIFYNVPALELLLPVGISFYTFQTLSYAIDVYRGKQPPEPHLGIFALYVSFFPQLVAGPIERSTNLLPQFYKQHNFDYQRVLDGLQLMAWGFFKKLVIADRLAVVVNTVYNHPTDYTSGVPFLIATYFFAFQIYCDFSGYTDIALGAAKVLGYDLMENFRRPYFSRSISEFWTRWHISLSSWFKDYLYIPLGGNRVARWQWCLNLMIVFLVSGLWHGANWTFVIWGGLHGLYLVAAILTAGLRANLYNFLRLDRFPWFRAALEIFVTFHLVVFAWIFFRANSISDAFYIVGRLFEGLELKAGYGLDVGLYELAISVLAVLFMEFVHLLQTRGSVRRMIAARPVWVRWPIYYAAVFSILLLGKFGATEFIYFQF